MARRCCVVFVAMLAAAPCFGAGDYKAGSGDSVKKWPPRDFEGIKGTGLPLCIYICDPEPKKNSLAKDLEGKDVLASAEVKDKLKSFVTLKVKNDGTDAKGWPADWTAKAKNGAAIVIATSDLSHVIFIDKSTPRELRNVLNVVAQLSGVLAVEKKKAELAEKKDKAAAPPPAEKTLPGLPTEKKDIPSKPPEKKKPVGPADE